METAEPRSGDSTKASAAATSDKAVLKGYMKMAIKKLERYSDLDDATGWTLYDDKNDVSMWTKEHETSPINYVKRKMIVNKPIKDVMDAFQNLEI